MVFVFYSGEVSEMTWGYIAYLRDNPKGYWFKRKIYGWGWTPAKWQGWLVTLIFILYLVVTATIFIPRENPFAFTLAVVIGVVFLIYVAYTNGQPPKWCWGIDDAQKD